MAMVNIYEAKTNLSRLVEEAAEGNETIIAKAGRPLARLVCFKPEKKPRDIGKFEGQLSIPDDAFDIMGAGAIRAMFQGDAEA